MGRGSRGNGSHTARRPVDLTGIISLAEKNDFVTLVHAITDRMLTDMCKMFDSPPVRPICGQTETHHWLSLPLLHRRDSNKENILTVPHFPRASAQEPLATMYEKAHQIIEKEENEAMTPQLRELKKEAIAHFNKWQANVLQRLGEINVNDTSLASSGSRGRQRRGRGGNRAGRGGRNGGKPVSTVAATLAKGTVILRCASIVFIGLHLPAL